MPKEVPGEWTKWQAVTRLTMDVATGHTVTIGAAALRMRMRPVYFDDGALMSMNEPGNLYLHKVEVEVEGAALKDNEGVCVTIEAHE